MITTSLDAICRRWLLEQSLPIHFYCEALFHAATCIRELNFSVLKIINVATLVTDDSGSANLPDDFVDDVAVCIPGGQILFTLPKKSWINPIRLHDSVTGNFIPYTALTEDSNSFFGFPYGWSWFWGAGSGYKIVRQRRQIQITEDGGDGNIIFMYISDGQSVDNATQIDPQAFATVNAFINFKRSPNKDNENSPEGRTFYNQRRHLIARLDDLTTADIRNVLHGAYTEHIKN